MKRLLAIITLALPLQGCFVAGAAAGAAAVAVVYDHRTISNTMDDVKIGNKVSDNIRSVPALKNDSHIEVTAFNGVVLLTGETPRKEWREQAGEIARAVPNVTRVYNQLTIQGPTSSLTRTSDSWITTKVRAEMLAKQNLKSSSIKVVTESGTVYLMGVVTQDQADIAVDIARQVSGVQRVVKIFQYTSNKTEDQAE